MQYEIELFSDVFNKKFDVIEGKLTAINDLLEIVEAHTAQMSENWNGVAENVWIEAFARQLEEIKKVIHCTAIQAEFLMNLACSLMNLEYKIEEIVRTETRS